MDTLIELYDERAIENVIGPETFRPRRIVYLYPQEWGDSAGAQRVIEKYFAGRGFNPQVEFVGVSLYKAEKILRTLREIHSRYPDCALEVTGGTDAALLAAGMFCGQTDVPAFTYSRKRNCFYGIHGTGITEELPCTLSYSVEDFFRMTGGTLRRGRVDNGILAKYMPGFEDFFRVFLEYRVQWTEAISFMKLISQQEHGEPIRLAVHGSLRQHSEHGRGVTIPQKLLYRLQQIGYLKDVRIEDGKVSFSFADTQIRTWLRDVGSVLELYMYKMCCDAGVFGDVVSSAVVDWDGTVGHDSVSNEIDVAATRGATLLCISCKACEIKTEAINELAILRDRFGGKGAKAVIVTTERCGAAARHRAAQMNIAVIDLEELQAGTAAERLRVIMKVKPTAEEREEKNK